MSLVQYSTANGSGGGTEGENRKPRINQLDPKEIIECTRLPMNSIAHAGIDIKPI